MSAQSSTVIGRLVAPLGHHLKGGPLRAGQRNPHQAIPHRLQRRLDDAGNLVVSIGNTIPIPQKTQTTNKKRAVGPTPTIGRLGSSPKPTLWDFVAIYSQTGVPGKAGTTRIEANSLADEPQKCRYAPARGLFFIARRRPIGHPLRAIGGVRGPSRRNRMRGDMFQHPREISWIVGGEAQLGAGLHHAREAVERCRRDETALVMRCFWQDRGRG